MNTSPPPSNPRSSAPRRLATCFAIGAFALAIALFAMPASQAHAESGAHKKPPPPPAHPHLPLTPDR